MYVEHFFKLNAENEIRQMIPNFGYGLFGEAIYYMSYSRRKPDGSQEHWADTVIRVINGVFSIRKNWYVKNNIEWKESEWQNYALQMAKSMFRMEWLPPGRGLWAMGTDFVYQRGSMALYNCAWTQVRGTDHFVDDLCWIMDTLMYGVGVGFGPTDEEMDFIEPEDMGPSQEYIIPDSREGWVNSLRLLLNAFIGYNRMPKFDYSQIRPEGTPIKGFGGTASGPGPLKDLHDKVVELYYKYSSEEDYSALRFKTDIANLIGCCVVAGNVRRSAEIATGPMTDEFIDLKNYTKHPYRAAWGWMSNNSVCLQTDEDFERLDELAQRIIDNGEPGYLNLRNFDKGRIGDTKYQLPKDRAIGINPCGEIPLEHREVCNLSETLPTRCANHDVWLKACEYASFYCSTVTLLPTHQPSTNGVVARNRRIGVGLVDFVGWKQQEGLQNIIKYLRAGYNTVRNVNSYLADEAGIPHSIRVTTVKPGGTTPKMAGRRSGVGHSNFVYQIRRVRMHKTHPLVNILKDAGLPWEPCVNQPDYTIIFEFPVFTGHERSAEEVSLWEQAMNLILVQKEWADNAVSNTLNFRPKWKLVKEVPDNWAFVIEDQSKAKIKHIGDRIQIYEHDPNHEEDVVGYVLASIASHVKSVSMLPHTAKGVYKQMPEEGITQEEYRKRIAVLKDIDWSQYTGSDGIDEKFCSGDKCEVAHV